jgi:tRNA pseudouridine55 synthase
MPTMHDDTRVMDGLLVVDKPFGWTSYDVVEFIKKRFHLKKVGHGGTLDPIATGLLVVGLGKATRRLGHFMTSDKTYRMTLRLGRRTDTQDITGKILREQAVPDLPREKFEKYLDSFRGEIVQVLPKFSAIKYKGKPFYYYTRKGVEVPIKTRRVFIHELRVLNYQLPLVELEVSCGTGTYMRTLCDSLGEKIGCGGCLEALVRTRCGTVTLPEALDVRTIKDREDLRNKRYWSRSIGEPAPRAVHLVPGTLR